MDVHIRPETSNDYEQVRQLYDRAFGQERNGILVGKLRQHRDFERAISLVAEYNGNLVGHILLFPVQVTGDGNTYESIEMAPIAVLPEYQRKGIGSCLVYAGLEAAKKMGYPSVIVLGPKDYFPRFGFEPAKQWNIRFPLDVPDEYFMAIELVENGLKNVSGILKYPDEFNEVD